MSSGDEHRLGRRLTAASRPPVEAIRAAWPSGAPGYVLLGLVVAGGFLRLVAVISWWPTTTILADSALYAMFAESNPFADPQHPAGYGLILAGLGSVTREVAVPVLLQHLSGVVSALLMFAATRRVTGSAWTGLLPAGIVLLNPDQIFLEHAIMAESWAVLATSVGFYAAVRAFDEPEPWWRWPLLTGAVLGFAVTIRTAGLFVIPVVVLALFLLQPQPLMRWRERWRGPVAVAAGAVAILLVFATANATVGQRFGIGPSPGWYLYGRAATFADCSRFTPPPGTEFLCEETPAAERRGARYYLFDPEAPAPRAFGAFQEQDDPAADSLLAEWSQRAVLAQPRDYLTSVWHYLRAYWVPDLQPVGPLDGEGLDPLLDFTFALDSNFWIAIQKSVEGNMEQFYNDFAVTRDPPGLELLRAVQQVFRFGGTALSIATLLVLLGLLIGSRRSRVGVLLFGIGGLALIVAPALTGTYTGRYTVPMAGPLIAAAAITILEIWRRRAHRRRVEEATTPEPVAPTAR